MSASLPTTIDLASINEQFAEADAPTLVQWAHETFGDGLVLTTSFGVQSAVMLHLVTQVVPKLPVVFVDTGFHFFDTYRFADQLTERLGLNLVVAQARHSSAWTIARHGKLWEGDTDDSHKLDQIHKVEPMARALDDLGATATLAGLRREQTDHRKDLPPVVFQRGRHKIHPILRWSQREVHEYLQQHELPYHPLTDQGYASIGDWTNTLPITAEGHERDGRFGGLKQECGLHLPETPEEDASRMSSGL